MNNNRLTIIESPFAGERPKHHKLYLHRCVLDSLSRNETPFASHGFFPEHLDDSIPEERKRGIDLGFRFWDHAKQIVFYIDYGMSAGMITALDHYLRYWSAGQVHAEIRRIGPNA